MAGWGYRTGFMAQMLSSMTQRSILNAMFVFIQSNLQEKCFLKRRKDSKKTLIDNIENLLVMSYEEL